MCIRDSSTANGDDQTMVTLESGERRVEIINDLLMLKYYQTESVSYTHLTLPTSDLV